MSKPDKSKKSKDPLNEPKEEGVNSKSLLDSFLKTHKDDHYNFEDPIDYKVSSGSLLMDYFTDGGLNPGLHRFVGINEGGKSASSLQFLKNFLDKPASRKGLYVKAEGRLSKEMQERAGVKFVTKASEWEDGTCYIYESNIYESVVELMRDLVGNNPEKINYFFILDSVDGLMRRGDKDKTFEESAKVAGGAVIAADFMKRVSISLAKRGHIAIFISQVRADIKLDPYSKVPIRQTTATGGNALLHFANWIFEFEGRFKGDQILLDDKKPYNEQENPFLGHFCKITVKKSPNEKTNCIIKYPIRYGRKNGTSNWIEKEILDFLLMWELAVKKGAWIVFDEELLSLLKESGIENFPAQIQGVAKFESLVNGDVKLKTFFFNYISKSFLNFSTGVEIANVD